MAELLNELKNIDRKLFPSSFTIRALRDSRYHNTAYALSELIDNSVEASAGLIEILCQEAAELVNIRSKARLSEIAVLDNGSGMDAKTLVEALKFGGGTRHNSKRGIGKYGMGLPTSSMSQCKKVDIWTWQQGPNSVWHSSIDADEVEVAGDNYEVPIPNQNTPIPDIWKQVGNKKIFKNKTGTLVVWSKLDKIQWKTGKALIDNTAREVGRIHRHYINVGMTKISAVSFQKNRPDELNEDMTIVANDPLYLMSPNSIKEEPWNTEAMFKEWGKPKEYTPKVDGKEQTILVKYSIVKPEALKTDIVTQNPGYTIRGKHARHNIGVSVVREDREIILEDAFLREGGSTKDPQNRWWGCEVQFFRDCDELFGVDHNKQMVANFTQVAKTLARDDRSPEEILDEMGVEDDVIYQIVGDIRRNTRSMMRDIEKMYDQIRGGIRKKRKNSPEKKAVETATEADRDAITTGKEDPTHTDQDREKTPSDERIEGLKEQYVKDGNTEKDAQAMAEDLVKDDIWYKFRSDYLDGYQMFNIRSIEGVLHITLNTDHSVYDLLKDIESSQNQDEITDENHPAFKASVAIRLLLSSWARMEDQTENKDERIRIQDIATKWGRQVDKFINQFRARDV